jgi:hypothetical protein
MLSLKPLRPGDPDLLLRPQNHVSWPHRFRIDTSRRTGRRQHRYTRLQFPASLGARQVIGRDDKFSPCGERINKSSHTLNTQPNLKTVAVPRKNILTTAMAGTMTAGPRSPARPFTYSVISRVLVPMEARKGVAKSTLGLYLCR